MKARVTQNDIARAAGVHNTTVSLSLRNSPAIPEITRKRIQAIAEEMGYYPDPALQALVAYRNGRTPSRRQETLAYITNWRTKWGWQDEPAHGKFYAGAQRRASECGFQLEHFWLGEPGMTQRRLNSMLFHRGITGVMLASHRVDSAALLELDWSRLAGVKIGCFPHSPPLHRVMDNQLGAIREAMQRIVAAGYQRIGFVVPRGWDNLVDQAWSIGFFAEQSRLTPENRVPVLLFDRPDDPAPGEESTARAVPLSVISDWLQRYQPDVVVSFGSATRSQLDALGLSVPRDVAYVDLFLDTNEGFVAGVRENCERAGEVATEVLVSQMHQNLRGIPAVPTVTLVDGAWRDGESLPSARPVADWSPVAAVPNAYRDKFLISVP